LGAEAANAVGLCEPSRLATQFGASVERFRRAPSYDFSVLSNGGAVYYGSVDWGMTPARWWQLAADSLSELFWAEPSI